MLNQTALPETSENESSDISNLVDRVHIDNITPDMFHTKYRLASRPLLISGALQQTDDWTLDYLREKIGSEKFQVRCYGKDHLKRPKYEWSKYCEMREMSINSYAQHLESREAHKEDMYLAQVPIGNTSIANDVRSALGNLSERCDLQKAIDLCLWLGPTGHTEPLHWDSGDTTVLMLHGAKRAVLLPPEQRKNLYSFSLFRSPAAPWFSKVYVDNPDYETFPKLREAMRHKIEIVINRGDILYIPVYWWHEFSSVGDDFYSCSVNRFWKVKPLSLLTKNKLGLSLYISQLMLLSMAKLFQGTPKKPMTGY